MNQLESQISKILEKAIEVAEKTGDFAIEQAPELLQEFYNWHTIKYLMGCITPFLILFIFYRVVLLVGSKKEIIEYGEVAPTYKGRYYDNDRRIPLYTFGVVILCCSIAMFFKNIYNLCKILIAPKIYLIEYFL